MPSQDALQDSNQAHADYEALKVENLLLRQAAQFSTQFDEHVAAVEKKIATGKLQLGIAGLAALVFAWFGTYEELGNRVTKRIDAEFGRPELQRLFAEAADRSAYKIMHERLGAAAESESDAVKCLIDGLARDLFMLQCHMDGGESDLARGVCVTRTQEERSFAPAYPQIDCTQG